MRLKKIFNKSSPNNLTKDPIFKRLRLTSQVVFFIFDAIRPILGPPGCCIYSITCRDYAKITLQKKPVYFAIPMIVLRILSCNPITALFLKWKKYFI